MYRAMSKDQACPGKRRMRQYVRVALEKAMDCCEGGGLGCCRATWWPFLKKKAGNAYDGLFHTSGRVLMYPC